VILKKGIKGDDVKELQKALNALKFNCGPADGIFGPGTELQVELFQESAKIHSDRIVGRHTLKILNEHLENAGQADLKFEIGEPEACPNPSKKLKWVKVPADQVVGSKGYAKFTIREDAAEAYLALREEVLSLGGHITSAGGRRVLSNSKKSKSKSTKSLHYVGLAIDLALDSGMGSRPGRQPFVIEEMGDRKWNVWCKTENPDVPERTIEAYTYHHIRKNVTGRYFSFTELAEKHGWYPIRARSWFMRGGKYTGAEWWHFQFNKALEKGKSKFGTELLKVYDREDCEKFAYWDESKNCTFGIDWF
jgi:hypothetical protein